MGSEREPVGPRAPAALPPVSVVMPVYNGERYVAEAIESVLAQTHTDLELVVIDDGSTDRTWQILQSFAARDARVRAFTQTNRDQAATLNRGLGLARHEWAAIIDHDDVWLPTKLERQLQTVRAHPEVRVLGTYADLIDATGSRVGHRTDEPTTVPEFWRMREANLPIGLVHPSALVHRPTALALGGYRLEIVAAADTDLWSRFADEHVVLVLPETLVRYRVHADDMTTKRWFDQREQARWMRDRERARRAGRPEPTLREFRAAHRGRLGWGRTTQRVWDLKMLLRRRAAFARWAGHPVRAGVLSMAAAVLSPRSTLRRPVSWTKDRRPARLARRDR